MVEHDPGRNYAQDLEVAREHGILATSAGAGRVPRPSRADFAAAAAVVLTTQGHVGQVYELAGDVAWDFPALAAAMSEVLGREVVLQQLSPEERVAQLQQVGLDAGTPASSPPSRATSATASSTTPTAPCPA